MAFRDSLTSLVPFPRCPPPKPARGSGSAVCYPSGVWRKAPVDKRFGAHLSQKEQLWWQQFWWIFIRINLNFCTNTRLLSSRYSVNLRAKLSVGSRAKAPGQGVRRSPLKLIMLMTFCNLMHKFVMQVFLAVLLKFIMAFIYCQK